MLAIYCLASSGRLMRESLESGVELTVRRFGRTAEVCVGTETWEVGD